MLEPTIRSPAFITRNRSSCGRRLPWTSRVGRCSLTGSCRRDLDQATYERAEYTPLRSLAGLLCQCEATADGERIDVTCSFGPSVDANAAGADGGTRDWWLHKRYSFDASGRLTVDYRWNVPALPADAVFAPELSLAHPLGVRLSPDTDVWRWSIQTITQSERGLESIRQGESVTPRWPAGLGAAMIELVPGEGRPRVSVPE